MGRKSMTGGVTVAGTTRIKFDLKVEGVRYRPTLPIIPTEMNLRRARDYLGGIEQRITSGTFSFAEEFPYYRFLRQTPGGGSPRTCDQVFDAFLVHC